MIDFAENKVKVERINTHLSVDNRKMLDIAIIKLGGNKQSIINTALRHFFKTLGIETTTVIDLEKEILKKTLL